MARNGMVGLGAEKVRELARTGAEVTVRNLRAEISAIERAFVLPPLPPSTFGRISMGNFAD